MCNPCQARENCGSQFTVGFDFAPDWSRKEHDGCDWIKTEQVTEHLKVLGNPKQSTLKLLTTVEHCCKQPLFPVKYQCFTQNSGITISPFSARLPYPCTSTETVQIEIFLQQIVLDYFLGNRNKRKPAKLTHQSTVAWKRHLVEWKMKNTPVEKRRKNRYN